MQQALDAAQLSHSKGNIANCSLDDYLYTRDCPPVELLVRTSGEQRLSDFMLRQSSHALLVFTGVLWPDFGFLDLVSAILLYQKKYTTLQAARQAGETSIAQLFNQRTLLRRREEEEEKEARATRERPVVPPKFAEQLISLILPEIHGIRAVESDSPCSVATPGSGSSPSSRSDGSRSTELSFDNKEHVLLVETSAVEDAENNDEVPLSYPSVRRRIVS